MTTFLSWLFRRNSDLSYSGIAIIYAVASVAFVVLLCMEQWGIRPQTKFMADLNGTYIIFAPYVPCLLWTLFSMTMQKQRSTSKDKKQN
jgi:hypothetical protein